MSHPHDAWRARLCSRLAQTASGPEVPRGGCASRWLRKELASCQWQQRTGCTCVIRGTAVVYRGRRHGPWGSNFAVSENWKRGTPMAMANRIGRDSEVTLCLISRVVGGGSICNSNLAGRRPNRHSVQRCPPRARQLSASPRRRKWSPVQAARCPAAAVPAGGLRLGGSGGSERRERCGIFFERSG